MIKKYWEKYKEIIMYLIFGVLTTFVSWGTYAGFTKIIPQFSIFSLNVSTVTSSNILSWICAVLFAFITNKIWVFDSRSWKIGTTLSELWKFTASRIATGVLEWFGVPFLVSIGLNQRIFNIEGMWSKVIVSVAVVILNYVFSKLFVFKGEKKKTAEKETNKTE